MTAKEAIKAAKHAFSELFSEEQIGDLGLEEIEFDDADRHWRVTVGYHRLIAPSNDAFAISFPTERIYKVITMNDADARVLSIKGRASVAA